MVASAVTLVTVPLPMLGLDIVHMAVPLRILALATVHMVHLLL